MREFIRAVVVLLAIAALGAASPGVASAVPCSPHEQSVMVIASQVPCVRASGDRYRDREDGDCNCNCCSSVSSAILVVPLKPFDPLAMQVVTLIAPRDQLPRGITVLPLTGPPKLSA